MQQAKEENVYDLLLSSPCSWSNTLIIILLIGDHQSALASVRARLFFMIMLPMKDNNTVFSTLADM